MSRWTNVLPRFRITYVFESETMDAFVQDYRALQEANAALAARVRELEEAQGELLGLVGLVDDNEQEKAMTDRNDVLPVLDDNDLIGEFDATVWAERFVVRAAERPQIATDMGAMTAWFASAIMSGFDRARDDRRHCETCDAPIGDDAVGDSEGCVECDACKAS